MFRGGHYNSRKRVSLWVRAIRVGHPWAGSKKNPAISVLPPINAEASAVRVVVEDLNASKDTAAFWRSGKVGRELKRVSSNLLILDPFTPISDLMLSKKLQNPIDSGNFQSESRREVRVRTLAVQIMNLEAAARLLIITFR
ncbi:hypothetical protein ALC62_13478 [Cyphomyrmex costatus]|uniref:Uncharacterized protein n=1 Tax=Cyphomyrmex costatus TaxID=456900 RepID=A0A151I9Z6_9HYME|nr:hypothetical protein ALC62_13478 [Cyphomyrmex costatus]